MKSAEMGLHEKLVRVTDGGELESRYDRVSLKAQAIGKQSVGAGSIGAQAVGALAVGALELGAVAVGTMAIGRLVVGRLLVGRSRIRSLSKLFRQITSMNPNSGVGQVAGFEE